MAYGTYFTFTFLTNQSETSVTVNIEKNDYVGSASTVTGAGRSPFILEYDSNDDILNPIRGCAARVSLISDGTYDQDTFLSANDFEWRCSAYIGSDLIYQGFLSQEDSRQQIIYQPYPVNLVFTDGLALLKNKDFGDDGVLFNAAVGFSPANVVYYSVIHTKLELPIRFFSNIWPDGVSTSEDTWAGLVFFYKYWIKDDQDDIRNAYDLLEEMLKSMGLVMFQANGGWNIISVLEWTTYGSAGIAGAEFTWNISSSDPATLDTVTSTLVPIGRSQQKVTIRPVQKIVNTFNYKKPIQIPNIDLRDLGDYVDESTTGDETTKRYELSGWQEQNTQEAYICTVFDNVKGVEVDRFIQIVFSAVSPTGAAPDAVITPEFLVEQFDIFKFTVQYSSSTNSSSNDLFRFGFFHKNTAADNRRSLVQLNNTDPATNRLNWNAVTGSADLDNVPSGLPAIVRLGSLDGTEYGKADPEIFKLDYPMAPFQFDTANMQVAIHGFNNDNGEPNLDCRIKGFTWEYIFQIKGTDTIIGNIHTITNNDTDFKNTIERDVFIDDSPRILAKGTMWTSQSGQIEKTTVWAEQKNGYYLYTFGELFCMNEMKLKGINRTLMEGQFIGLASYSDLFSFSFEPGKYFIPGRFSIDYKSEIINSTFFEVYSEELEAETTYEFRHKYELIPK